MKLAGGHSDRMKHLDRFDRSALEHPSRVSVALRAPSPVTLTRAIALATLWMAVLIASSYGQNPTSSPSRLYAVVFGFVIDETGELKSFRVEKVVDPNSGSTEAVDVKVPDSFVSAARAHVMAKGYKGTLENGTPKEMYTYFFFDPKQPDRADIQPQKRK